jgi:hypothetical protein
MTPTELRTLCDHFNDRRGTGGQTHLASILGWTARTMRAKLAGKSPISRADELAIHAVELAIKVRLT